MARIVGMPWPTAGSAVRVGRARTVAQAYRRFGEVDAAGVSRLYERIAVALSESDEALRAIEAAPARKRHPALILAALHDLALAGRAPALAAAYATADGDAAVGAAIDTLLRMTDAIVAIAVRRKTRTNETGRCAVLYPAIADAARRVGANAVGLIDVGCSAGLNLNVDRLGITYSNGQSLGDPSSPVQLSSSIVGDRPIPTRAMPEVVARVGVDLDPVDVTDADDARWLRACLWPDQPERVARLEAEMALAATAPPLLLHGDAVEVVPGDHLLSADQPPSLPSNGNDGGCKSSARRPRAVSSGDMSRNGKTSPAPAGGWLEGDEQRAWLAYIRVQLRLAYEMNRQLLACNGMSLPDYYVLTGAGGGEGGRVAISVLAAPNWQRWSPGVHHLL